MSETGAKDAELAAPRPWRLTGGTAAWQIEAVDGTPVAMVYWITPDEAEDATARHLVHAVNGYATLATAARMIAQQHNNPNATDRYIRTASRIALDALRTVGEEAE